MCTRLVVSEGTGLSCRRPALLSPLCPSDPSPETRTLARSSRHQGLSASPPTLHTFWVTYPSIHPSPSHSFNHSSISLSVYLFNYPPPNPSIHPSIYPLYPAAHPHPSIGLPSVCQVFFPPDKYLVQCQELVAQGDGTGVPACGLGAAGGLLVLLGCVFVSCNCTFPHKTSCSVCVGRDDCTLYPPGEAHRTPTSTFPGLACC